MTSISSTATTVAAFGAAATTTIAASQQQHQHQHQHQQPQAPEKWVTVTWMPHTMLSPTSHVCLSVRSAHAVMDPIVLSWGGETSSTNTMNAAVWNNAGGQEEAEQDWRVRIGIYAIGGWWLVPVHCHTPASPVLERRRAGSPLESCNMGGDDAASTNNNWMRFRPTVAKATHDCQWNSFLKLPIRWRDLPRDAYLRFEIVQDSGDVAFEATMPFFTEYGKLVTGLQKVELHIPPLDDQGKNPGLYPLRPPEAPSWDIPSSNTSIREEDADLDSYDPVWEACCILDQLDRMQERARAPNKSSDPFTTSFGQIPSLPWLDALMKARAEATIEEVLSSNENPVIVEDKPKACLIIELPVFEIPIMHEESFYPTPQQGASGVVTPLDLAVFRKQQQLQQDSARVPEKTSAVMNDPAQFDPLQLVSFLDYENEHDNPVEDKYRTLAHDLFRGLVDPALKPDRTQRDRLASIIDSTSHHLSREEKDLLWRFRFSLVDNRRALTKFLLAVDWTVDSEVVQAAELLEQWRNRSPIQVTDALKLLGKHVAFQTNLVRSYAIDTLEAAPDSELRLYLLPLVQALKYENTEGAADAAGSTTGRGMAVNDTRQVSSLAAFLIHRASRNMGLANFLYWYLKVELDNPTHGSRYRDVFTSLQSTLSTTPFEVPSKMTHAAEVAAPKSFKSIVGTVSSKIGTPFRSDHGNDKDKDAAGTVKAKSRTMWDVLSGQDAFISGLLGIQQQCRDSRGKKDQKEEDLRTLLAKGSYRSTSHGSVPLPTTPDIYINGVNPDTAKIFKSALYPALIDFHVDFSLNADASEQLPPTFKVIVKTGDDLRQDQLVIMMIQLMDGLLKRAALDLCLTPYSILATSPTSGLVEFVEGSAPISQVLSQHNGSILLFFQARAPQLGAKLEIRPEVLSTYVRSLAGYCVITYLLGVGDRHLDNIMLRSTGHFFHIDFGFIFGRDPKPLPPAFRLTREMVDGMGGQESSEYRLFCSLACQAYNALRKSAGLVLNLLHLMSDSGVEDLSNNPSADAEGVIAKVEERFRLDLTDEQAERYFIGLINDCLAALAPRVMDVFHSFAVARR